jgi:hypothetical protein
MTGQGSEIMLFAEVQVFKVRKEGLLQLPEEKKSNLS